MSGFMVDFVLFWIFLLGFLVVLALCFVAIYLLFVFVDNIAARLKKINKKKDVGVCDDEEIL